MTEETSIQEAGVPGPSEVHKFLLQPCVAELANHLAKAVIGPSNLGAWPVDRTKLAQLREIRWEQATMQEQGEALTAARAVLAELFIIDYLPDRPPVSVTG